MVWCVVCAVCNNQPNVDLKKMVERGLNWLTIELMIVLGILLWLIGMIKPMRWAYTQVVSNVVVGALTLIAVDTKSVITLPQGASLVGSPKAKTRIEGNRKISQFKFYNRVPSDAELSLIKQSVGGRCSELREIAYWVDFYGKQPLFAVANTAYV